MAPDSEKHELNPGHRLGKWAYFFPILPFLPYFRPYRSQLAMGFVCLAFVAVLEPLTIIFALPAINLILAPPDKPVTIRSSVSGMMQAGLGNVVPGAGVSASAADTTSTVSHADPLATATLAAAPTVANSGAPSAAKSDLKLPFVGSLQKLHDRIKGGLSEITAPYERKLEELARQNRFRALALIAAFLIGTTVIKAIFDFGGNYFTTYVMRRLTMDLQNDIFKKVMLQDYLFFKQKGTGYLISRISSDIQQLRNVSLAMLRDGILQPLTLIFMAITLVYLSPQMSALALWVLPVGGVILYRMAKRLRNVTKKSRKKSDEQSSYMEEALRNYPVVKTFGTEETEIARFQKQSLKIFELNMRSRVMRFGAGPLMEGLGAIALGGVLLVGGYLMLEVQNGLTVTAFIGYLLALTRFYEPLKRISRMNMGFQEAVIGAERLTEMLALTPKVVPHPEADASKPLAFREAITLDHATFGYTDDAPVLTDVSLCVQKGKVVALVGPSGAGKSTLMNLLPRLFDPQKGSVLLDGVDVRKLDVPRLRALFGVVTQDTILFDDTVLANICYGSPELDRKRAEECARAANAHEFISQLDKGYDSEVGPAGSRLSGGQRQRLAIARAFYRNPEVLLLDEATSNLDTQSETLVQQAMDHLLEGRTAVVIAHRLSTIRRADLIVVMENGRIVEQGTHEQLISNSKLYKHLYALQNRA